MNKTSNAHLKFAISSGLHKRNSGERRLLACSCRQLAGNTFARANYSASCRDEQAGSLCSPAKARYALRAGAGLYITPTIAPTMIISIRPLALPYKINFPGNGCTA